MFPHYFLIVLLCSYAALLANSPQWEIFINKYFFFIALPIALPLLLLVIKIAVKNNASLFKTPTEVKNKKAALITVFILAAILSTITIFYWHGKTLQKQISQQLHYGEKISNLAWNARQNKFEMHFVGVVTKNRQHTGKYFLRELTLEKIITRSNNSQTEKVMQQLLLSKKNNVIISLRSYKNPSIKIGDVILVKASRITTTKTLLEQEAQQKINASHILSPHVVAGKLVGYSGYLLQNGIAAVANINVSSIKKLSESTDILLMLNRAHRSRAEEKATQLTPSAAALLLSLLTGEKNYLPPNVRSNFITTGTYHMLAISGMHIGLLLAIIIFALQVFRLSFHTSFSIAIAMLPLVLIVFPFSPSILRTYFMAVMAYMLYTNNQKINLQSLTSVCFFAFLLLWPYQIYTVGFQFSFAAVFTIALCLSCWGGARNLQSTPKLEAGHILNNYLFKTGLFKMCLRSYFLQTLFISSAIFITTLPISLAVFNKAHPSGIFYNLFIPPLVLLVLLYSLLFYLSPISFLTIHFAKAVNFLAELSIVLTMPSSIDNFLPRTIFFNGNNFLLRNILLYLIIFAILLFFILWAIRRTSAKNKLAPNSLHSR